MRQNPSWAASIANDEHVFTDVVLCATQKLVADTDTTLLVDEYQKYRYIPQQPLQELPDYLEQGLFSIEMKLDLFLADPSYNGLDVRHLTTTLLVKKTLVRWWRYMTTNSNSRVVRTWFALHPNIFPDLNLFLPV